MPGFGGLIFQLQPGFQIQRAPFVINPVVMGCDVAEPMPYL